MKTSLAILGILAFGNIALSESLVPTGAEVSFVNKPGLLKRCGALLTGKKIYSEKVTLQAFRAENLADLKPLVGTKAEFFLRHDQPRIIPAQYKYKDYLKVVSGHAVGPVVFEEATAKIKLSDERNESYRRIYTGNDGVSFAAYVWHEEETYISGVIGQDADGNYVVIDENADTRSLKDFLKEPGALILLVSSTDHIPH